MGVAYKKNVNDTRESPALRIIDLLAADGGVVSYHDAYVATLATRSLASIPLTTETLAHHDVVVVVTDHDGIDWDTVVAHAPLVVDLRHAVPDAPNVWRL
jgi:UDP-N-acetyl-D-glucosamine dehydrogenase